VDDVIAVLACTGGVGINITVGQPHFRHGSSPVVQLHVPCRRAGVVRRTHQFPVPVRIGACLLACCLIAPHKGNNTRFALEVGERGCPSACCAPYPRVCCQCVRALGSLGLTSAIQTVSEGLSPFRFLALGLVLACPRLPRRSQRR
jgi:hypothetical protein